MARKGRRTRAGTKKISIRVAHIKTTKNNPRLPLLIQRAMQFPGQVPEHLVSEGHVKVPPLLLKWLLRQLLKRRWNMV